MRKIVALSVVMAFAFVVSPSGLIAFTTPATVPDAQTQQVAAPFGSVKGTALDKDKKPLVGAKANLINAQGQTVKSTTTGAGGAFTFTGVAPGNYTVQIVSTEKTGGVEKTAVVGTMATTVTAGTVATITIATTAAAIAAAAAGGILGATSLLVIGAVGAGVAVTAVAVNASSSS